MPDSRVVLDIAGVHHSYGQHPVLYDVNLRVARGQIVSVVGPSGCGKSTLLNAVVGFLHPTRGIVLVVSKDGTRSSVRGPGRDRGIVFQNYALFDFLTAEENVAFGLMLDQTSVPFRLFRQRAWRRLRHEHLARVRAFLNELGLGYAIRSYPSELSGGMRQRVAIAQALIMEPEILLLDEPFGALDEATREELQRMLLRLYAQNLANLGNPSKLRTIIIVTHELTEAIFVADRVVGLSQYWDWKAEGLHVSPGATIVYDAAAPIYGPDAVKEYEAFAVQREAIQNAVFSPSAAARRNEFVKFWEEVREGRGKGVLSK